MKLQILKQNKNTLIILAIVIIGFTLYANSFNNQMFWDDDDNILNNEFVHNFQVNKFFSENLIAGAGLVSNYWRPALLIAYSLEWQLWGDSVLGYHLVNTLVHILTAIALFYLLEKLFKNKLLAFLTSLVFLVHPVQTEAVTYVSGLGDPLSSLFTILGIYFYLKFRDSQAAKTNSWYYMSSLGTYVLAVMSKDSAVVMPALIALADFFYLPQNLSVKQKLKLVFVGTWPFFALFGVYTLLRATALNFQNTFNLYNEQNQFTSNFTTRLFTFFGVLTGYFSLLFFPVNLHFEKNIALQMSLLGSPETIIGALIAIALTILAFSQIRRNPIISFGIFWFGFRLFPHSNLIVPTSGLMHEHWLYLPLIGIYLIIIWLGLKFVNKKILIGTVVVLLLFFGNQTITRNQDWQDPITFYNQTLKYTPNNYRVVNNLGMSYAAAKQQDLAEQSYLKAIELDPNNAVAHHNLGNTYVETGQTEQALQQFKKAIELQPDFIFSYPSLINLSLERRDYATALNYLAAYQKYRPNDPQISDLIQYIEKLPAK
ncbi:MAG: tetratricopeptide repeat protein [Candidatus Doudnabacteria bacterium]|nr:tetratricopeptide repeat protein [Candidatus Doudnabacteria bacterium]